MHALTQKRTREPPATAEYVADLKGRDDPQEVTGRAGTSGLCQDAQGPAISHDPRTPWTPATG